MQQNIDQLFKDGVDALTETPVPVTRDPQASWNHIEDLLGAEKRNKRRGAWIWVSVAASVALLIGIGWMLSGPSKVVDDKFRAEQIQDSIEMAEWVAMKVQQEKERIANGGATVVNDSVVAMSEMKMMATSKDQLQAKNNSKSRRHEKTVLETYDGSQTAVSTVTITSHVARQEYPMASSMNVISAKNVDMCVTSNSGVTIQGSKHGAKNKAKQSQQKNTARQTGTYSVVVTNTNGCTTCPPQKHRGLFRYSNKQVKMPQGYDANTEPYGSESYDETVENDYFKVAQEPQSTFSIDVDRASYTNHRRFIDGNSLPPKYSVRVEEFINYFPYEYQQPRGDVPFSILPEVASCPWNPEHKLVRIALKGREVSHENVPASNIVFLLDVSGSMGDPDKLPLLKQALIMLTEQLRAQDKVSIVVYAGAAGLVLPPTSGNDKTTIMNALNRLESGGSTAGGQGIELAYATAKQNFMKEGNNRVILATDGDFNVGVSDNGGLEELIVRKRAEGVFLSVLGFGEGNLQDSKMELLADKGNGNYNYIDGEGEAKKVLVTEFGGTLLTIAKDVKIQVEFNPANVASYRLIGYENRKLKNEDFANDKIDAGELGAGHTVTALYEVVPANGANGSSDLKYQQGVVTNPAYAKELLTVKLRYKEPNGAVSKLIEQTLKDDGRNITQTSNDFRWAVAVAAYGLILRESAYKGTATLEQVVSLAKTAVGADKEGYRREFIDLVTKAANISQTAKGN
jgi:Ca-activated chloride channel homolog